MDTSSSGIASAIGLNAEALGQFDEAPMLAAAELLADAKVDVIAWNGTGAGWLGLRSDRELCARITRATEIPTSTFVLALFDVLQRRGERRIGLVTPYTADVQVAIVADVSRDDVAVVAERHLGLRDNFSFGRVDDATLKGMIRDVAAAQPWCSAPTSPPRRSYIGSKVTSGYRSTTVSLRPSTGRCIGSVRRWLGSPTSAPCSEPRVQPDREQARRP